MRWRGGEGERANGDAEHQQRAGDTLAEAT